MGWIKRNLFFVIGGVVALVMLGLAGFYIYKGWSANSEASTNLDELYAKLQELQNAPQKPGDDKTDNIKKAKEQEQQLRDWIAQARAGFVPIQPIPQGDVTSKTYATALGSTVYQLQQEARQSSINLPPQYNFSFQVQSTQLTISSGLGPLAEQLGQVKAICEILFGARINELEGIQRVRVSEDDANGPQSDYLDERPQTNDLAIITPYVVTFQTFTPELAKALGSFATSPNAFIVKSVTVQPATPGANGENAVNPTPMPQYPQPYGAPNRYQPYRGGYPQNPMQEQQPQAMPGTMGSKGGLQTVLKEQLLRITLEVEIVKLLPKS